MSSEFTITMAFLIIGIFCWYLAHLDKKGKDMVKTEKGRKEYANRYLPERLKYKSKTIGKANSRQRMSKKERRKINKEQKEK
ncbi:hypothetical protein [Clostridium massiliamazoniense]|uniref:hypothetical protein n=1 Tax=Clostridium massiliamazoniense TaxID=1347366 RepID=UPI0006D7A4BF|nr:hypothetical protein [Clostridium massiliamazoniense]